MLHYILQILIFQLLFLVLYELFLKRETFFSSNRWYLLITPLISLLLPFVKLDFLGGFFEGTPAASWSNVLLPEVYLGAEAGAVETLPEVHLQENQGFQPNWWLIAYFSGFIISLILLLRKSFSLWRLFRFKKKAESRHFRLIEVPKSRVAFSFYKTVFLGADLSETEKQQILLHELVHVKQLHSLDLLLFEVLKIIFWFNPLVYIFQQKIAMQHEFLADDKASKTLEKKSYFEQLLNTAFNTQQISFTNQFFNHSLIKKRIIMLQKSKSKSIAKFKFLIIVPLLAVMLMYVSCSDDSDGMNNEDSISEKLAEIKEAVDNGKELNEEEVKQLAEIMAEAKGFVPPTPPTPPESPSKSESSQTYEDVPYAVVDEVPVFSGCEDLGSNEERKNCMTSKITEFVSDNFNTDKVKEFAKPGVNRVIVQFKIDKTGKVVNAKARAAEPELEKEGIRVISSIPDMEPGKQDGQNVGVMYSLPIVFQIGDE